MKNTISFAELLKDEKYNFLRNDGRVKSIFLLTLGGSHAYGMNIEESDLDLRGGSLNSKNEILLGQDFEQVIDRGTDTTIYSFNKLIKLLSSCNPNVIELLGCKKEHYIILDDVGKLLLEHRRMFLSKECIHTFEGYANSQLRRLENKSSREVSKAEMNAHILKSLENARYCIRNRYKDFSGEDYLNLYLEDMSGDGDILFDISLRGYPLRDYVCLWSELKNIVSSYDKASRRNSDALKRGKLGKHMAHLLRLYMMCIDILEEYDIYTYRSNEHDLLMSIRNGDFLDSNKQPTSEFYKLLSEYEKRLDIAKSNTKIPDKPDIQAINKIRMNVNEMIVLG